MFFLFVFFKKEELSSSTGSKKKRYRISQTRREREAGVTSQRHRLTDRGEEEGHVDILRLMGQLQLCIVCDWWGSLGWGEVGWGSLEWGFCSPRWNPPPVSASSSDVRVRRSAKRGTTSH